MIDDAALARILHSVHNYDNLQELNLFMAKNRVTDASVVAVCERLT